MNNNKNEIVKASQHDIQISDIFSRVITYIENAKMGIQRTINAEMVKAYWFIGQEIVIEEQKGEQRAEYGKEILQGLSLKLKQQYGKGFSVDVLERARKFFIIYKSDNIISATVSRKLVEFPFEQVLSWSHYVELIKIHNTKARKFYEIETIKNNWSVRELSRQVSSLLYERLTKNKNKEKIMKLAVEGQELEAPEDMVKDPLVLEFLGLPESHKNIESKIEQALIDNLQSFLLELGRGFAFLSRQKRLTLNGNHYYADIVFYHVILKCYVIVDIKSGRLEHSDLGQMQFYVNYFDQEIKSESDNPTIGLLLCTEKCDKMVQYTLGDKAKQIFASKYKFHLPTESELETELKREIALINNIKQNKLP